MFGLILESIGTTELLLLFVLAAVIIPLIYFVNKSQAKNLKKCPYCAEMIREEAVVCRYCGRDV